jgi:hypothetical protein
VTAAECEVAGKGKEVSFTALIPQKPKVTSSVDFSLKKTGSYQQAKSLQNAIILQDLGFNTKLSKAYD